MDGLFLSCSAPLVATAGVRFNVCVGRARGPFLTTVGNSHRSLCVGLLGFWTSPIVWRSKNNMEVTKLCIFWKQEMMSNDKKPNKTTRTQNLTYIIYLITEMNENMD